MISRVTYMNDDPRRIGMQLYATCTIENPKRLNVFILPHFSKILPNKLVASPETFVRIYGTVGMHSSVSQVSVFKTKFRFQNCQHLFVLITLLLLSWTQLCQPSCDDNLQRLMSGQRTLTLFLNIFKSVYSGSPSATR